MGLTLLSVLFLATQGPLSSGGVVTETMRIEIDNRTETAREINGRWWSEDNRELTRTNVGWLWNVSSGNTQHLVRFDHHQPVDLAGVSRLDRSMGPSQVRQILGAPNSIFPSDVPETQQHWDYYGSGGYKLSIRFNSTGGIFNATFEADARSRPQDVPHLAFRVNGQSVRELNEANRQDRPESQIPPSQEELRRQLLEELARRRSERNQTPR